MDSSALSAERLAPAVRSALHAPEAWPVDWTCEPIRGPGVNPSTAGLYRVRGTARTDARISSWRLVLKVLHLPDLSGTPLETGYISAPEDWNYWRREVLARRSGLPERFTSPVRPVACWATEEVDGTTAWLWLEELEPMPHPPVWTLAGLAAAAHDLGAFAAQGIPYLEDLRRMPWAARDWLRGWLTTCVAMGSSHALSHEACWTHPLVRNRLPPSVHQSFTALMTVAEPLLGRLDRLPRTVAHRDTQASNLFSETSPHGRRTVLIDWGFLGDAPIGEDLGHHIALNVYGGVVNPGDAAEHEQTATQAYLAGLREHGWDGNDEDVRFAAVAVGALRMLPFAACHLAGLCPAFGESERWPEATAEEQGRDIGAVMDTWCESVVFLAGMADRATLLLADD